MVRVRMAREIRVLCWAVAVSLSCDDAPARWRAMVRVIAVRAMRMMAMMEAVWSTASWGMSPVWWKRKLSGMLMPGRMAMAIWT